MAKTFVTTFPSNAQWLHNDGRKMIPVRLRRSDNSYERPRAQANTTGSKVVAAYNLRLTPCAVTADAPITFAPRAPSAKPSDKYATTLRDAPGCDNRLTPHVDATDVNNNADPPSLHNTLGGQESVGSTQILYSLPSTIVQAQGDWPSCSQDFDVCDVPSDNHIFPRLLGVDTASATEVADAQALTSGRLADNSDDVDADYMTLLPLDDPNSALSPETGARYPPNSTLTNLLAASTTYYATAYVNASDVVTPPSGALARVQAALEEGERNFRASQDVRDSDCWHDRCVENVALQAAAEALQSDRPESCTHVHLGTRGVAAVWDSPRKDDKSRCHKSSPSQVWEDLTPEKNLQSKEHNAAMVRTYDAIWDSLGASPKLQKSPRTRSAGTGAKQHRGVAGARYWNELYDSPDDLRACDPQAVWGDFVSPSFVPVPSPPVQQRRTQDWSFAWQEAVARYFELHATMEPEPTEEAASKGDGDVPWKEQRPKTEPSVRLPFGTEAFPGWELALNPVKPQVPKEIAPQRGIKSADHRNYIGNFRELRNIRVSRGDMMRAYGAPNASRKADDTVPQKNLREALDYGRLWEMQELENVWKKSGAAPARRRTLRAAKQPYGVPKPNKPARSRGTPAGILGDAAPMDRGTHSSLARRKSPTVVSKGSSIFFPTTIQGNYSCRAPSTNTNEVPVLEKQRKPVPLHQVAGLPARECSAMLCSHI
eukprot:GEMP01018606.1.p1 GENE.GEMP01018606.1~~GEMP01018606.1.p1  ORF type:complete len:712 (+),score=159.41 GEMP01018606.1:52-2187(+)